MFIVFNQTSEPLLRFLARARRDYSVGSPIRISVVLSAADNCLGMLMFLPEVHRSGRPLRV